MLNIFKILWNFLRCKSDDTDNTIHFYQYPSIRREKRRREVNLRRRIWIEKQIAANAVRC